MAAIIGGSIAAAGALGSAAISSSAAGSAAKQQQNAAALATQAQLTMFNKTQENLAPFIAGGRTALDKLLGPAPANLPLAGGDNTGVVSTLDALTAPFKPTMESLAATPGYQFALTQGLQATQNQAAAMGLGRSGTSLANAANYAEGLASTTYQQQFNNYLAQNAQIYNLLSGVTNLGETAAAGLGGISTQTGAQIGSNIIGAGNAAAAGTVGSANAISGAFGSMGNTAFTTAMLSSSPGLFGNPPASSSMPSGGGISGLLPFLNAGGTSPSGINTAFFSPSYDPLAGGIPT